MKATKLMVGDWVLDGKKPAQITGIMCDDLFETTLSPNVGGECISPIPLTPEILGQNGFDVSDKEVVRYYFKEDGEDYHFSLRQMYDKDGKPHGYSFYAFNVLSIIDYVHELQHAMRLCGIEKEIEI